ncbi:hypothetical protein MYCTH_2305293 [Thermothelomyces thermophilus ATCC 42464]|uniref:Erythromycin esterase n=1 Tax=Thermothelomyces thermophilus (strain ATCC 42464 / BCRC 31852 / DSM 1799) TaxID=573729 RepID=G2QCG6_THET4|nr:uncharacterized protein MYCTH_2305293 [Thermothelomyces thermophilus ATCC 42464]AEO58142.1 hypothetical protein MYCTH_2305293 [Thermothelomyces thermophilus ATCC 42464]
MARRSARLASLAKASKQASETPTLSSVAEYAEHDEKPADAAPESVPESAPDAAKPAASSPAREPKTPSSSSPIKPPLSEMHPSKVRPTMAPPSSGLRLGFTDIKPTTGRDDNLPAVAQTTPSRVTMPSSQFTFRVTRGTLNNDLGLGPEAQRMMVEVREQAEKHKEAARAQLEAEKREEEKIAGRKIAQAKGKAGRFSAAHMAQFKKMDSIENHPSAFRAQPGRVTSLKAGVKRSQSKANLDEPETNQPRVPTPAAAAATASTATKRTRSTTAAEEPVVPAKRARQNIDEDTSSKRPTAGEGSSIPVPKSAGPGIPRPKGSLAALMTPTKSSLARTTSIKTPGQASLAKSPSKAALSGIPRSATTNNLPTVRMVTEKDSETAEIKSPKSPFDRVKAMLRGAKAGASKPRSALPLPSALASKTPAPARPQKELPTAPLTTPGRKLTKRVAFTPDTRRAALTQNSPSPIKPGAFQGKGQTRGEVHYPSLDGVMAEAAEADVSYPDLSAQRPLPAPPAETSDSASAEPSLPGEFTFRSDHTISFGSTNTSFGSSPGQASVRIVRPSIMPTEKMPGSFPTVAPSSGVNKENEAPRSVFLALPHGMSTKKRHRVSTDEEEAEKEAAERAVKKRKQEQVPEGDALLAPRLVAAANANANASASAKRTLESPRKLPLPGQAPGTPSPMKKKGISLSRLNMLARPKMRK